MSKCSIQFEMYSKIIMVLTTLFIGFQLSFVKKRLLGLVLILIGLYWSFNRDFYLPFLGKCVIPPSLINPQQDENKLGKKIPFKLINLPPNTQIIYWASIPSKKTFNDPQSAYDKYQNSGTTISNNHGEAFILLDCPSNYSVGMFKTTLKKHVHYRYAIPEYLGLYSSIYTADILC